MDYSIMTSFIASLDFIQDSLYKKTRKAFVLKSIFCHIMCMRNV